MLAPELRLLVGLASDTALCLLLVLASDARRSRCRLPKISSKFLDPGDAGDRVTIDFLRAPSMDEFSELNMWSWWLPTVVLTMNDG
jgi:hypothetical protein